jgi:ankyrin repeat protein
MNNRDHMGAVPLHYAATGGSRANLELLLKYGQDANLTKYLGEPPIFNANHSNQIEIVLALIDHGISWNLQDKWGFDVILDAVYSDSHDTLSVSLNRGMMSRNCLHDGKTILHVAALNSDLRTIELLLEFNFWGVNPHTRDNAGHTALEYMRCRRQNESVFEPFCALVLKAESDNTRGEVVADRDSETSSTCESEIFYEACEYISMLKLPLS